MKSPSRGARSDPRTREARLIGCVVLLGLGADFLEPAGLRRPDPLDVVVVLLSGAALLARDRRPVAVLAAVSALAVVHQAYGGVIVATAPALTTALYGYASRTDRRSTWTAAALVAAAVVGAATAFQTGPVLGPMRLGAVTWIGLAAALGDSMRNRRAYISALEERAERAERTREEEAACRVAEERVRIARELHDVVAHELTLINAQAGIGAHVGRGDPAQLAELLVAIRDGSRGALDELRSIVGLLGRAGETSASREPAPGLARLDELVTSFGRAGLHVDVSREGGHEGGHEALSSAVDVTGYRIVQEALTNVRKHARTDQAAVRLRYGHEALRITVENPAGAGRAHPVAGRGDGTGRGLIGIRERAAAAGGTAVIGPRPDGGFVVDVRLPMGRGRLVEGGPRQRDARRDGQGDARRDGQGDARRDGQGDARRDGQGDARRGGRRDVSRDGKERIV
ncbi:sensor histidine kinase [Streptomyces sp. NPDC058464]|uniref:sensor histidine kinase n=1 Tax=Streptomyces sp. NPDC058464 TaxID=3346511 RepID=UPI003646E270